MLCLERKDPRDPQDGVGFIYLNSRSCRKTLKIIENETLSLREKCWWRNRGSDPVGLSCRVGRDPWSGFCRTSNRIQFVMMLLMMLHNNIK